MRRLALSAAAAGAALALPCRSHVRSTASAAATVPAGFTDTLFATGFGGRLTSMTFAPDGRLFVSEKQGACASSKNGVAAGAAVPDADDRHRL